MSEKCEHDWQQNKIVGRTCSKCNKIKKLEAPMVILKGGDWASKNK